MTKFIIAIDGPAASGKGTLSRKIAQTLNAAHMDTGALYRAVGLEVLEAGGDPASEAAAIAGAQSLLSKIKTAASPDIILHNTSLREDHVGQAASKVAAVQEVRDILLQLQRDFAADPGEGFAGAVLDGRDIGSVVCPHADVKLFVTASAEIRADRRTKELQSKGFAVTYEAVLTDMRERDARDAGREAAPMIQAADALTLDTGALTPAEMLEKALNIINAKLHA